MVAVILDKNAFDAALIDGSRRQMASAYRDLRASESETLAALLDDNGDLLADLRERRPCPICGAPSDSVPVLIKARGVSYLTCPGCGLTYARDVLTPAGERRLFEATPFSEQYSAIRANPAYGKLEAAKARYIVGRAMAVLPPSLGPAPRTLDIGAGGGAMMRAARAAGGRAEGIEANPSFVDRLRADGLEVARGLFPEDWPADRTGFAVVTMLDVLEHVRDPCRLVASVRGILAPGGLAVVQVPNLNSLVIRVEGAANNNFCPSHWSFFTRRTLEMVMTRCGFVKLFDETIISEIDRLEGADIQRVRSTFAELTGDTLVDPSALSVDELHRRYLGYKVLGLYQSIETNGCIG